MAWSGFFEYGGVEIINVDRTEAYADHVGLGWFRNVYSNGNLGPMLDEEYSLPMQDDAPWVDGDDPNSWNFYGCYPLTITGIEDSTQTAEVVESTRDGGIVGSPRRSTRSMVFQCVLIGADECAVEYGARWLRSALTSSVCGTYAGKTAFGCAGQDLCYLNCPPSLDWTKGVPAIDVTHCMDPYLRTLHKVAPIVGPIVTQKATMTSGGAAWIVDFTLVAGNPAEYGILTPLVSNFPAANIPYAGGKVPDGGAWDSSGSVQQEVHCQIPTYQPVYDPQCPQIVPPPGVPSVALSCFTWLANYRRRQIVIPGQFVPLWGTVVPVISLTAPKSDLRQMRVRFYADPQGGGDFSEYPCSHCVDLVFSYIPAGSTLVLDGVNQLVYLDDTRGRRRADSLVFNTSGEPFEWPELTCGIPYVMTLDTAQTGSTPRVDVSLASKAA
jgi:hypothetical protein